MSLYLLCESQTAARFPPGGWGSARGDPVTAGCRQDRVLSVFPDAGEEAKTAMERDAAFYTYYSKSAEAGKATRAE